VVPTPYRGRVDLGHVILRVEIDDIDSPAWWGTISERPVPGFVRGAVGVQLFDGPSAGRRAKAEALIANDQTAVLHGEEPFSAFGCLTV
jgi:hypothetical protein